MPRVNIYVRNDDMEQWEKVYTPDWLHDRIQESRESDPIKHADVKIAPNTIISPKDVLKKLKKTAISKDTCPHGLPWLMCKNLDCNRKGRDMGL